MNLKQNNPSLHSLRAVMADHWKYVSDGDFDLSKTSHFVEFCNLFPLVGSKILVVVLTTGLIHENNTSLASPSPSPIPFSLCIASMYGMPISVY